MKQEKSQKSLGLPTFPIFDGMVVGHRSVKEMLWLLDNGFIQRKIQGEAIRKNGKLFELWKDNNKISESPRYLLGFDVSLWRWWKMDLWDYR